jgi:hypothetical protein
MLRTSALGLKSLLPPSVHVVPGAQSLVRRTQDLAVSNAVFHAYVSTERAVQGDQRSTVSAFVAEALNLERVLTSEGFAVDPTLYVPVAGGVAIYVQALSDLSGLGATDAEKMRFRTSDASTSLEPHFESHIMAGNFRSTDRDALRILVKQQSIHKIDGISSRIGTRLESDVDPTTGEREALLDVLFDISPEISAANAIKSFVENGWAAQQIARPDAGTERTAVWRAACLHAYLRAVPSLDEQRVPNEHASQGYALLGTWKAALPQDLASALARRLLARDDMGLLDAVRSAGSSLDALVGAVLAALLEIPESSAYFTPKRVARDWGFWRKYLEPSKVVIRCGGGVSLLRPLRDQSFNADYADLYRAILIDAPVEEFAQWCADGLKLVSADRWRHTLSAEDALPELIDILEAQAVHPNVGASLSDAWRTKAHDVSGGADFRLDDHRKRTLFIALDPQIRQTLQDEFYEMLRAARAQVSDAFLRLAGEEMIAGDVMGADRDAYTRVLSPLIDARALPMWQWLLEYQKSGKSVLAPLSPAHGTTFRDRLARALRDDPEDETREVMKQFAALVGIQTAAQPVDAADDRQDPVV